MLLIAHPVWRFETHHYYENAGSRIQHSKGKFELEMALEIEIKITAQKRMESYI